MSLTIEKDITHNQDMRFTVRDGTIRQTSQGYWLVDIAAARTGLQTYITDGGRPQVRFRSFEEVTALDSMMSWEHAPITIFHPKDDMTLKDTKERKMGYVFGIPRIEHNEEDGEDYVVVSACLDRQELIDRVQSGELVEVSAGYQCYLDKTPGKYKGMNYDAKQVRIKVNHLSFLPPGMARAGRFARVRLSDGLHCYDFISESDITKKENEDNDLKGVYNMADEKEKQGVNVDNVIISLDPDSARAVRDALESRDKEIASLKSLVGSKSTTDADLQKQIDTMKTQLDQKDQELTNAKADQSNLIQAYLDTKDMLPADFNPASVKDPKEIFIAALQAKFPSKDFSANDAMTLKGVLDGLKLAEGEKKPVASGVPSGQAKALYDQMEKAAATAPPVTVPTGLKSYHDSLYGNTQKRLGIN